MIVEDVVRKLRLFFFIYIHYISFAMILSYAPMIYLCGGFLVGRHNLRLVTLCIQFYNHCLWGINLAKYLIISFCLYGGFWIERSY